MARVGSIGVALFLLSPFTMGAVPAEERSAGAGLSEQHAAWRAQHIKDVSYELFFSLGDQQPDFSGNVRITFQSEKKHIPLTVDFSGGTVASVTLNEKTIQPAYNGHFLAVPAGHIAQGSNNLVIEFSHPYSKTGSGLYRMKDSEDGRSYVYSDFEPYDANQMFPSFDQPDLKATYRLSVEAPKEWTVVSTMRESKVALSGNSRQKWDFPVTPRFSTYIFSLHAGPYRIWEDKTSDIPLRLMARQSLAKYVAVDEWFQVTRQGFAFYQQYFSYPYPFGKYDQVIVPDFNSGAMENVGAVTFSERFVQRGRSSFGERDQRASVILHEMAHMWFGNLVTMRWWDDLWLNESFATYMSHLAQVEGTEAKYSWQTFFAYSKGRAYVEDQSSTTHPVAGVVPHTDQAFANFDGITYGKGASVMKQLSFFVGAEKFRDGVRDYFKKHEFGNATLKDFIAAQEKSSGVPLTEWSKQWIETSGFNDIAATPLCKGDALQSVRLEQNATKAQPHLRTHRVDLAFYRSLDGKNTLVGTQPATVQGDKTTVAIAEKTPCPTFVDVNHDDHDYSEMILTENNVKTVLQSLKSFDDGFLRLRLWAQLWNMVRAEKLAPEAYGDAVLTHLDAETSLITVTRVLQTVSDKRRYSSNLLLYLPPKQRSAWLEKFAALAWRKVAQSSRDSDIQTVWFETLTRVAEGKGSTERLTHLLNGREAIAGLEISQDRRWEIIVQLNAVGANGAPGLITTELQRDPSHTGQQAAIAARTIHPGKKSKDQWFDKITDPKSTATTADLRAAMRHFFPLQQENMRKVYVQKYLARLPYLASLKGREYLITLSETMTPTICEKTYRPQIEKFLQTHTQLPPIVVKNLTIVAEESGRCAGVRHIAKG